MKRYATKLDRSITGTMDMGLNYPVPPLEVFPGESFRLQFENLTRFLPQVFPTMHNVNVNVETYEVPYRQLFEKIGLNWDDFLTGGEDGNVDIGIPQVTTPVGGYAPGSLADWLGIPTNFNDPATGNLIIQPSIQVSALPVIAYMHVINENYRDQNFIKKLDLTKYQEFLDGTYQFEDASGNDIGSLFRNGHPGLFPRAWQRDYFGRAMPNTQRGPISTINIGGNAPLVPGSAPVVTNAGGFLNPSVTAEASVVHTGAGGSNIAFHWSAVNGTYIKPADINNVTVAGASFEIQNPVFTGDWTGFMPGARLFCNITTAGVIGYFVTTAAGTGGFRIDNIAGSTTVYTWTPSSSNLTFGLTTAVTSVAQLSGINADLAEATAINLLQFRLAAKMQQFGEMLQQAGARAVEYTLKFFGVRIPDARVQRPIYHGAYRVPVMFSEVLQTSQTATDNPLGRLGGHGITGGRNQPMLIKCIEHGFIIHIISIMPRSQFHNILPKMYLRKTRFDIPNPIFSNIGEQAIDQIEIYPRTSNPTARFGYVPRYNELSYMPSTVHGHMKDTFSYAHMARIYTTQEPVLSAAFRYELPPNRSFAVQDEDQVQIAIGIYCQGHRMFSKSPMAGIHIV